MKVVHVCARVQLNVACGVKIQLLESGRCLCDMYCRFAVCVCVCVCVSVEFVCMFVIKGGN